MKKIILAVLLALFVPVSALAQGVPNAGGMVPNFYAPPLNFGSYGQLTTTPTPNNAVADIFASQDGSYHDNVLTMYNKSLRITATMTCTTTNGSITVASCGDTTGVAVGNIVVGPGVLRTSKVTVSGNITATGFDMSATAGSGAGTGTVRTDSQCGNAATRFIDPYTGGERGAVGYSVLNTQCLGFNPNTLYAEIGNLTSDANDTSFRVINTHSASAINFTGLAFTNFEIVGSTGNINFYNHLTTRGFTWDETAAGIALGSYSNNSVVPPTSGIIIPGKLGVGTSAPGDAIHLANGRLYIDQDGAGGAAGHSTIGAIRSNGNKGCIRYTEASAGAVCLGYWSGSGAGVLGTDGSTLALRTAMSDASDPSTGTTRLSMNATAITASLPIVTPSTDASASSGSGALQVVGGASIAKRFWIPAISASAGLQTAVLCQSSGGEMIADSVACLASGSQFKNIRGPMEDGALDKIKRLPIDRWDYKAEGNFTDASWTRERIGPIAQDVAAMDPRLAGYDKEGNIRTFSPDQLLAFTIKAVQEHARETDVEFKQLKAENDNLRACNDNWKCRLFGVGRR